jgi:uncharacterized protein (DUF983 family)
LSIAHAPAAVTLKAAARTPVINIARFICFSFTQQGRIIVRLSITKTRGIRVSVAEHSKKFQTPKIIPISRSLLPFPALRGHFTLQICDIGTRGGLVIFSKRIICSHLRDGTREEEMIYTMEAEADRPLGPSLLRGWRSKCPNCGSGPLLKGYLQVRKTCSVCREDFTPQKADDGPAYLTILIVGHIMAPLLHMVFVTLHPEPLIMFTIFAVGCVALSLYLLPRLKGAVIAFQWARRMHGF